MNVSFEFIDHLKEILRADSKVVKHLLHSFFVFPDVAEDGLGKVLHHILGLGLFFPQIWSEFHHLTIRTI